MHFAKVTFKCTKFLKRLTFLGDILKFVQISLFGGIIVKKINDNQMDEVVGGKGNNGDIKKIADKMFPKIKIKCADCGKEIEVTDDSKVHWAMIASEFPRHDYYHKRCKECAIKKPYFGDVYDSERGIFVRDFKKYWAKFQDKNKM